jgi:hypothetical protein
VVVVGAVVVVVVVDVEVVVEVVVDVVVAALVAVTLEGVVVVADSSPEHATRITAPAANIAASRLMARFLPRGSDPHRRYQNRKRADPRQSPTPHETCRCRTWSENYGLTSVSAKPGTFAAQPAPRPASDPGL